MVDLMAEHMPLLQLISAHHEPEKLLANCNSTCGFGHRYCASVLVSEHSSGEWKPIDPAEGIELPPQVGNPNWVDLIESMIFAKQVPHDKYLVRPMICNGAEKAQVPIGVWTTVEVFPEVECKGEMVLGYAHPAIDEKRPTFVYEPKAAFKIGGAIEGKFGRDTFKFEADSSTGPSDAFPLVGPLLEKLGKSIFLFDMMMRFGDDVKGEILWPDLKMSMGLELVEFAGKPIVGPKGTFKFVFDPLIGFQLKLSILNLLIRLGGVCFLPGGPKVASTLIMLKAKFASDPKSFEMEIDLTVKGDIAGGLGFEYVDGRGEVDGSASKVEGGIGIQVEGRVAGTAKVLAVEFAGGGKVGVAGAKGEGSEPSRFGARLLPSADKGHFTLDGEVFFTGMAFYYLLFLELGAAGAESEKKDTTAPKSKVLPAANEKSDEGETNFKRSLRTEYKGSSVLLEPWSWKYRMIKRPPLKSKGETAS
jgi:hypothetical protein